ncbi:ABC transporter permease [Dongia soli]|uniref:ABC transmembrane type-1 domain-containing protein n=1 Tax=Dongia soli TaxID=600628 RepID=A0ABU5ECV5_9PROT|nr:hypothetical protein [Dongia soli]MDY0884048.1 hypothetical protein [Dongia soli]
MPSSRWRPDAVLLRGLALAFAVFIVLYIAIPIVITLTMSLNDTSIRFPILHWSLKWYRDFFGSPQWVDALGNSLIIAIGTTVISTIPGVLAAWVFERYKFPGQSVLYLAIMMPLFMPGVALGLGVAIAFGSLNIGGFAVYSSRGLVMLAHSLWAMPLVFMLMEATFRTIDHRIVEASTTSVGSPYAPSSRSSCHRSRLASCRRRCSPSSFR